MMGGIAVLAARRTSYREIAGSRPALGTVTAKTLYLGRAVFFQAKSSSVGIIYFHSFIPPDGINE